MFQLELHDARITKVNPRREKHGKEGKPGFDVMFAILTPNTTLDSLQKGLKEALYRQVSKGEQLDAFQGAGDLVALRFPQMAPVKLDIELTGCEIVITGHLETSLQTLLVDVKVDNFEIEAIEGGSAGVTFSAHVPTSETVVEELAECIDWWMYDSIRVSLVPPKNQAAANDAPKDSGAGPADDTLSAQDKDAAEQEGKRLVAQGKSIAKKAAKKATKKAVKKAA